MKPKILVVDDEPDALEILGFKLKEAGFVPIFAKDGARALMAARDERPALIVLDLMLPEVDGLEVCKILRRDPATATIPILMLTARAHVGVLGIREDECSRARMGAGLSQFGVQ